MDDIRICVSSLGCNQPAFSEQKVRQTRWALPSFSTFIWIILMHGKSQQDLAETNWILDKYKFSEKKSHWLIRFYAIRVPEETKIKIENIKAYAWLRAFFSAHLKLKNQTSILLSVESGSEYKKSLIMP